MLQALAEGETDPTALTKLAAPRLRATPEHLCDAFRVCPTLHPGYRRLLKLALEELRVFEDHRGQLARCGGASIRRDGVPPQASRSSITQRHIRDDFRNWLIRAA
jgi:hypothetical protein